MRFLFNNIVSFIKERHKASGGYGATKHLPATVEDTFHATSSLLLLKHLQYPIDDRILSDTDKEFLKQKWHNSALDFKSAYQILVMLSWTQLLPPKREVVNFIAKNSYRLHSLESFFYYGLICKMFSLEKPFSLEELPSLPSDPAIKELFYWTSLKKFLGQSIDTKWLSWLKRCQNWDGGFGFKPGTTSFVDTTHYTLETFQLLNSFPSEAEGILNFLAACQKPEGGFSRRPGAAAFLDATWHGTCSLFILIAKRSALENLIWKRQFIKSVCPCSPEE